MRTPKISMKDIAAACATTVPTVSHVLNGSKNRYVNAQLRERILSCAKEMGYTPPKRRIQEGVPRKIAIVLPQIDNIFFRRMILSMEKEACGRGYIPVIYHSGDIPAREAQILAMLANEQYCGFLLVPSDQSQITEETLRRLRKPYVIAERPLPCEGEYDFFSMDNFDAGYQATKELIRAGHRHIGIIIWQTTALSLLDRRLGYARALEEANILYRSEYVHSCAFSEEDCYRVTKELLSNQSNLTALIFAYHFPGLGGVRYLRDAGVRVPEDLSVFVIGNPSWAEMSTPMYTHITLPSEEIGAQAMRTLIRRIEEPSPRSYERAVLRGELVRGGSIARLRP